MNPALIAALATAIPAVLTALAAFVNSLRAKGTATTAANNALYARNALNDHMVHEHNLFPIQPPHTQAGDQ